MKNILLCFVLLSVLTGFAPPFQPLKEIDQIHLIDFWDLLSEDEKGQLSKQIEQLDSSQLFELKNLILDDEHKIEETIQPFRQFATRESHEDFQAGLQILSAGKVGCLIVAGGQGTRLGFEGPKGLFPVSLIKNKSLFQIFAEKALAAGRQIQRPLFLSIMTSSGNHDQTVKFFENHLYFGLNPEQVSFFSQDDLPLLDQNGNLFLETYGKIAVGPDGNAASLKHFFHHGIWADWKQRGIEYLTFVPIDNPLADPFDAELIGFHCRKGGDLAIKCIRREDPQEKLGVIVEKNGKVGVIEYSEISREERDAVDQPPFLRHLCGNISLFSFKMDFVRSVAEKYYEQLPYHKAWKIVPSISEKKGAWKFEKFIFDVLPFAQEVHALIYPREECFAPLKNKEGADSLESVQAAIQKRDIQIFTKVTGLEPEECLFELDPQFYYPTPEMLQRWKGQPLPACSYIEP